MLGMLHRLASGDNEGRVVVWDVSCGTVIASLEDPLSAALTPGPVARKAEPGKGGAVRGLAWIMSNPCVLGIVMTSGMFLVWDMQGGLSSFHLTSVLREGQQRTLPSAAL